MAEVKTWKQHARDVVWSGVTYLATATLGAVAAILGIQPQKIIEQQVQLIAANTVTGNDGVVRSMGWDYDPVAIAGVKAGLKYPVFAKTPVGEMAEADLPDYVGLWDLATKAIKQQIPTRDQKQVGSCVAFGAVCAVEYLQVAQMVAQMLIGLPPPEFKSLSQEVMYGLARVQIGGGQLRGSDGAVGAWAAKAANEYGVVARAKYGSVDLTEYSESRCRQYGDNGPPKELLPEAKLHLVKSISPIKTTADLRRALANCYPVSVASNVGYGMRGPYVRDNDGILNPSGSWSHQMCFIGYYKHPTRGYLYCIMNSWGREWVKGPRGQGEPPDGSFWVTEANAQRMLNADDSWAFSNLADWAKQPLDWFVKVELKPRRLQKLNLFNEVALAW